MRILIFGRTGQVATELAIQVKTPAFETVKATFLGRDAADLTDPDACAQLIADGTWDAVINAAAYTAVDKAETEEATALTINGTAPGAMARACAKGGIPFVHISTDYVFDGHGTAPYPVDHPHDPVNAYGRSKAAGETALQEGPAPFLCVRTAWLYAPWGDNFVRTMRRLMESRDTIQVVDDQHGRPTSASQLADTIAGLIDANATGFFHGTDADQTTWHGLAQHIADRLGYTGTVEPCDSDTFQRAAKRPAYSVLDLSKTETLLGPREPWTNCVDRVLDQLDQTDPLEPTPLLNPTPAANPTP